MRIAALYDIHSNLPALEAVLDDVNEARVDCVVVGGDVLPGPMPSETLELLFNLEMPVHFIVGNGDLGVLAQLGEPEPAAVTYWGTTSGKPLPRPLQEIPRWTARQLSASHTAAIASWPKTLSLHFPDLGNVLFCHGTPRSETECFTRLTPSESLARAFEDIEAHIVVCGHTHMQFDRFIGQIRVVNAGSVGMPFGRTGADWMLLDEEIELRHTDFDAAAAAARVRATGYPQAAEFAAQYILSTPSESDMLEAYTHASFQ